MLGYYKEPETTRACYTADGFFKTGDMGEIDERGRIRITGRVKDLFKTSKGKYVAPVPIENRLIAHPKIEAACVCGANQAATLALLLLSEDARKRSSRRRSRKHSKGELSDLVNRSTRSSIRTSSSSMRSWCESHGPRTTAFSRRR